MLNPLKKKSIRRKSIRRKSHILDGVGSDDEGKEEITEKIKEMEVMIESIKKLITNFEEVKNIKQQLEKYVKDNYKFLNENLDLFASLTTHISTETQKKNEEVLYDTYSFNEQLELKIEELTIPLFQCDDGLLKFLRDNEYKPII
jgi:regulator of replication initiation timing